jgi:hypothetical protein
LLNTKEKKLLLAVADATIIFQHLLQAKEFQLSVFISIWTAFLKLWKAGAYLKKKTLNLLFISALKVQTWK